MSELNYRALALFARIHPEIWDIIPRGPQSRYLAASMLERVSLNPQPLPPGAAVELNPQPLPPVQLQLEALVVAHEIVAAAIATQAGGGSGAKLVAAVTDDWCGTPPRPWPGPWPGPQFGPRPEPWLIATAHLIGSLVFASIAERMDDGELKSSLQQGAGQLVESAQRTAG